MRIVEKKQLMTATEIDRTLQRLAHEIVEKSGGTANLALIGIRRRGVPLAQRIARPCAASTAWMCRSARWTSRCIATIFPKSRRSPCCTRAKFRFPVDDKDLILVDDVLYTGRTIRAAMNGLFDLGRPQRVRLCVLIDRGHRELPVEASFVGRHVQTSSTRNHRGPPERSGPGRARHAGGARRLNAHRGRIRVSLRPHSRGNVPERLRHLLAIEPLTAEQIIFLLDQAKPFQEFQRHPLKKLATLRGKTVALAFFEPSTRTRISFATAAARLGADTMNLQAESSSLKKGESLLDTVRTLDAMKPDCIVMRHSSSGAADFVASRLEIPVINAGDGTHEHPTQALLDALTIRDRRGTLEGLNVTIIGDILHSRVARSNIHLLGKFGCRFTLCGPAMWLPREFECCGPRGAPHVADRRSPRRSRRRHRPARSAGAPARAGAAAR